MIFPYLRSVVVFNTVHRQVCQTRHRICWRAGRPGMQIGAATGAKEPRLSKSQPPPGVESALRAGSQVRGCAAAAQRHPWAQGACITAPSGSLACGGGRLGPRLHPSTWHHPATLGCQVTPTRWKEPPHHADPQGQAAAPTGPTSRHFPSRHSRDVGNARSLPWLPVPSQVRLDRSILNRRRPQKASCGGTGVSRGL